MSKYRDSLQIVADILSIVNDRAGKTRIMYQANLSYRLLCRYLGEVLDAGLVKPEEDDRYILTAKGVEFLGRHEKYAKRCRTLEEHANEVNKEKIILEKMCFGSCKAGTVSRLAKDEAAKVRRV
jgi:predicted transcriptional regulator